MKYARLTILLGVLVSALVAGLGARSHPAGNSAPPAPTEPAVVPTVEPQSQWEVVVPQPKVGEKLRMAAFFNESFGLTGGAGDVGKASYTSDGGQTWTMADSSGG